MFTALASMIGENEEMTVKITGAGKDGIMKVVVMPKLEKGSNIALAQPLALAATAEELESGFLTVIQEFGAARIALKDQVAVTATILDAAKKNEVGKATKGLNSKTSAPEAKSIAGDDGDGDGDGNGDHSGDDILTPATAAGDPKPEIAQPAPATQAKAPAAVNNNDDLLSLMD
jgi:PRTRC genetic system protein E